MNELCPMPGCRVEAITPDGPDFLHVDAHGTRHGGRCPDCGRASRAVHSRYRRHPADLPSLGRRVRVGLRVRRFYCRNARCGRRTFAEHLPELVAPHARRTCRLGEVQGRLARHSAVRRDLGCCGTVDDWALRKGRTYGTIVVDLERRRVVDLLPDRSSTTVADWLRQRPGIEVVARDRSTEYARAAALGAPRAVQRNREAVCARLRTAGMCWPTCATCWSAGWPAPTPGCVACHRCPMMTGVTPASAPAPSGLGAPRLPWLPTACPLACRL